MRYLARPALCVLVAVILVVGLSGMADVWLGEQASMRRLIGSWLHESRRSEALNRCRVRGIRCMEAHHATTVEVLAGHLTLREAIAQFRESYVLVEENDLPYVRPTTEHDIARSVIAWARSEVKLYPNGEAERIVGRLEEEFQWMFDPARSRTFTPGGHR